MYLPIPTWLVFLFLWIASFAPIASRWPGWWMAYHGALLMCWVLVSVAALRRIAREDREAKRELDRMLRQFRDAKNTQVAETDVDTVRHALAEKRLIIVARDEVDLYDSIRRDQMGDETVRVITDRRRTDRRLRMAAHIPDRRRGERRRYDIGPLLLTKGWAQVTLPES
jgi:membrane protein implicated in regulation of membrane protease activity